MTDPKLVLVVDDDEDYREICCEVLVLAGFSVAGVGHGQAALDWLHREVPPSLILLDLMMPVMNGWELHDELQREQTLAGIPVIVITAGNHTPRLPASAILSKLAELPVLLEVVKRHAL